MKSSKLEKPASAVGEQCEMAGKMLPCPAVQFSGDGQASQPLELPDPSGCFSIKDTTWRWGSYGGKIGG
jgi:putative lipase involved disintegration of autophagic bodies